MIPENPRILISNDDGVEAPGLAVLEEIARELSDDVWIAAPQHEQSGASRKMSLTDPVRVRQLGERRWSLGGTPSDAVFLGVHDLMDAPPDLILSGVNRGQNLAEDITVSGTIAAALQGMQLGIPSIALSQTFGWRKGDVPHFETARALAPDLLRKLCKAGWPKDVVLNINFPDCLPEDVTGVALTRHGHRDQWRLHAERREDLRGGAYYWIGFEGKLSNTEPGEDLHAIYNMQVSVTPIKLQLTDEPTRARLAEALGLETSGA